MIEWELQKAIYTRLAGDAELAGLGVTVVDVAGQTEAGDPATAYPYVEIGYMDAREWDTKTEEGADILLRIHTYTAGGAMSVPRAIQSRIKALLHNRREDLSLPASLNLVLIRRDSSSVERDPDRTFHGVCEYRALIEVL